MDSLAQREATQLRLNAELDAGALAAISDVESYLRAPPAHPTATKKPNGGASGGHNNNNRTSPIQAAVNVSPHKANTTNSRSIVNNKSSNNIGVVHEGGDQFHRVEQHARGQQRASVAAAAAAAGGVVSGATATPSTLFRLSERVKEAARASGERTLKKAASGGNLNYTNANENNHNSWEQGHLAGRAWPRGQQQPQQQQGFRQNGVGPGLSSRGGGGQQVVSPNGGGGYNDRDGDADVDVNPGGGGVPPGIGEEATARFLKAKLTSCQAQLKEVLQAHQASQQEAMELRSQSVSDQEQTRRVSRQLQQLQQTKAKESRAKEEEALNAASLSARVAELERELGSFRRAARQAETDKKSLEVRLHRALEEVSKQKEVARQARGQHKDLGQGQRLETSRLEAQCQRLERQKLELLSAFKKQLKLIDVLKRQKFHVEAARMLGFTEEDFVKTLDWDSR
ncbi:unnamed protein product [Pylaiella littoralis]